MEEARQMRAAWQPVFHSASLAQYAAPMRDGAERLMARLAQAEKEQKEVNIWRLLGDMTMDVVGTTAFGCVLATSHSYPPSASQRDVVVGRGTARKASDPNGTALLTPPQG
jgi:cytochrome P450